MAEYPELSQLVEQMNEKIVGKRIERIEINQEKCLNVTSEEFKNRVLNRDIISIKGLGKWIRIELSNRENIMLSLGMGGDVLYYNSDILPTDNSQWKIKLNDGNGFTCRFWWFGYIHLFSDIELCNEKKLSKIGFSPDDPSFTFEYFYEKLNKRKARIKNALLAQDVVSGIGNAYIHDLLFECKLHPNSICNQIPHDIYENLYSEIKRQMKYIREMKGLHYEKDFYGQYGKYDVDHFKIAYKEGSRCLYCNNIIEKIKTGSTSSYICPKCQHIY